MSVWTALDDKAKDGGVYAVWFREPPSKTFPKGYGYWISRARYNAGAWHVLSAMIFDNWIPVNPEHTATHYADMSPPEGYSL